MCTLVIPPALSALRAFLPYSQLTFPVKKFADEVIQPRVREMDEKEIMDPELIQGLFDNGVSTISLGRVNTWRVCIIRSPMKTDRFRARAPSLPHTKLSLLTGGTCRAMGFPPLVF